MLRSSTQALKRQGFDQILHFLADALRVFDELAIAIFIWIILFPVISIAVSFDVRHSALWAAKVVHGAAPRNKIFSASLLQRISPLYSTFQPYACCTTTLDYVKVKRVADIDLKTHER